MITGVGSPEPARTVCVAGAGVIGSLFAAHLARVAEVSALVRRPEHARALAAEGLRVSGRADFRAALTAAATDPAELPEPELVIVACKGTDLEDVAARIAGHWPGATVMTVQNGIGADEIVARHGDWPLLASVTFMSGTRHADTHVEYVLDTATWIGPARGTTPADARAVAELIESAGLKAEAFDDLRPAQWSKLIFNATVNTVAALTGLRHDPHFAATSDPRDLGLLVRDLMDEGKAVAAAAGVELGEDPWEMNVHATQRGSRHAPSMLEDVQARRRTEVDTITGALVREADRVGVPVPLHRAMYRLIKGKEASWE
ncbi:MAG TPA: 2-dehydropantoate 2-reductase [Gaiellaceae bacterium]